MSAKSRGIKHGELFQDKLHESYTVESQILFLFLTFKYQVIIKSSHYKYMYFIVKSYDQYMYYKCTTNVQ